MAEELNDGEFWLPPQFLSDEDDTVMENNNRDSESNRVFFPCDFPYGFGSFASSSALSSPVESVVGSAETESDEEDYITELTRHMTHSSLCSENTKKWVLASSPQSTLCAVDGKRNEASLDLLYAAAGEVAKMRMNDDRIELYNHHRGFFNPNPKPQHPVIGAITPKPSLSHLQYQKAQLRQQQILKQQKQPQMFQNIAANTGDFLMSSSAWPPLQHNQTQRLKQTSGSGMRAVFLGNPNSRRESTGTGVFLPRRVGTTTEPPKKSACSTVLVPARVVQALNLNLEGFAPQPRFNTSFAAEYDTFRNRRSDVFAQQQKRNYRTQQVVSPEISLPQEWTY